jgi:iron only hydrogenase large subunit-like protein
MPELNETYFHHALKVLEEVCIGCTHCMTVCPTQAIRVRKGKAQINDNRCIDCGECYNACPVNAFIVEQDDFASIKQFKARVALVPGVLIGQFPSKIPTSDIYNALKNLGFTHIFEVENTIGFILEGYEEEKQNGLRKPMISSFCPAVIRLIQVRFPSLIENIIRIKPPIDMSALYYRRKLQAEGFVDDEIGIFYVTPCAAKIASVKSPVDSEKSPVTGVINMKFLYNRIHKELSQSSNSGTENLNQDMLSSEGVLWSLTHGETMHSKGRALAIDGIHNVNDFLEKLENDEYESIDFLELRACDQGCAGGILISGNRFLTVERLKKRAVKYPHLEHKKLYLTNAPANNRIGEITARPIENLDDDVEQAIVKMSRQQELLSLLPDIDCAACGAPDCQTFAGDIVQNQTSISHCVFIREKMLARGELSKEDAEKINKEIWGDKPL